MLTPCASCAELVPRGTCVCPHCSDKACNRVSMRGPALLLGLTLAATGCGNKGEDSATTTSTTVGTIQADYTAASTTSIPNDRAPVADFIEVLIERGALPQDEARLQLRQLQDNES